MYENEGTIDRFKKVNGYEDIFNKMQQKVENKLQAVNMQFQSWQDKINSNPILDVEEVTQYAKELREIQTTYIEGAMEGRNELIEELKSEVKDKDLLTEVYDYLVVTYFQKLDVAHDIIEERKDKLPKEQTKNEPRASSSQYKGIKANLNQFSLPEPKKSNEPTWMPVIEAYVLNANINVQAKNYILNALKTINNPPTSPKL